MFLSPFRLLLALVGVCALVAWALLFIWLGVLSGFAMSYNVTLGRSSAFDPTVHGGHTAKTVAAILGVVGWIALPTVIGVFVAEYFARRLAVTKPPLTPDEVEAMIQRHLPGEGQRDAGPPS